MANWAAYKEQEIGLPVYKRARYGIHFQRSDGQIQAEFVGKPCHYEDGGIWKPIDTKLLAKGNGFYGCPHSDVIVHPDGRVAVEGTDYAQYTALPGAPTGKLDNDRMVREFTGGRQYLYITEDGFRQEIVLDKIPSLTVTNAKKLLATVSGGLPLKYVASQLTATDAAGNEYTYDNAANFRKWLEGAKYPVVIDPDFGSDGGGDTLVGHASVPLRNYGVTTDYHYHYPHLNRFILSSISSGDICSACSITLTVTNRQYTGDGDSVVTFYKVSDANGDWIEGTKNNDTAASGEPCWNYKQYDTVAWAGSAGMGTAGTDYVNTALGSFTWEHNTADGTQKTATFNSDGLAVIQSWFGDETNNGLFSKVTTGYAFRSPYAAFSEHPTVAYRPVLSVTYTASGIAIPVAQYYYNRLRRN